MTVLAAGFLTQSLLVCRANYARSLVQEWALHPEADTLLVAMARFIQQT